VRRSATLVTDDFLGWVDGGSHAPFFAFLNYFDAHAPYLPPPPMDTMFRGGNPAPTRHSNGPSATEPRSIDAYDGAVAYMDSEFGRLIRALEARGILDDTLVIVTSDHGEQFGEHGLIDHANSLYRQLLHVPLVVSLPSRVPQGVRIEEPVSLVDLAATIADLSGFEHRLPGQSLATRWRTPANRRAGAPVFSEISKGINTPPEFPITKGRMLSVVVDGVHYIRNGDGVEELYDFARDLDETADLAADPAMRAKLEKARLAVDETLTKQQSTSARGNAH
jgi:arylsulfatase A-like enzyme